MRILMASPDAPPEPNGGLGTYLDGLLGAMASLDVEVHLVATSRDPRLPRVSRDGGVSIHRLLAQRPWAHAATPRRLLGMVVEYGRLNAAAVLRAGRMRLRGGVDAVVIHDWMCAPAGLVCATLLRIPVAYHVHSAETFIGDGSRGMVPRVGRILNRAMSRRARLVVTPSYATIAEIPHLAARDDVVAISHGAGKALHLAVPDDAERAAVRRRIRERYAVPDGRALVVFSGRLAPHKGMAELIDAIPYVVAAGTDVTLVVSGSGLPDVGIDDRLRRRVARLGLEDRVEVLGRFLEFDDLRDHLVAADVCAFPSSYEPFGFMGIEAMALESRTVVGPGFDPAVVGSEEGACVRTATLDPEEIAAALVRVLSGAEPELGARARRYVLEHHTWEAAADRTLRVYADAFGG